MEEDSTTPSDKQDWGEKYGWFYSEDSDRVYNLKDDEHGGPLIIEENGDTETFIQRARLKLGKGKSMLWRRLGPVEINDISISQNTKIWHDDRGEWLQATRIELIEEPEPEPRIVFRVDGQWPKTELTYPASRLAEMREEGVIESQKEVNDRAAETLEQFRKEKQQSES